MSQIHLIYGLGNRNAEDARRIYFGRYPNKVISVKSFRRLHLRLTPYANKPVRNIPSMSFKKKILSLMTPFLKLVRLFFTEIQLFGDVGNSVILKGDLSIAAPSVYY